MVTSKKHARGTILSAEDRAQLRKHFDATAGAIEEIAKITSRSLGRGDELPVEITFRLSSRKVGTSGGPVPKRQIVSVFTRDCYGDGSCGCTEDPPGISYSC